MTDRDKKLTRAEMVAKADELLADAFVTTQVVMNDKSAPATSRSSAVSSALAIHRLLVGDDNPEKEPADMTYDELRNEIERLERKRQAAIESSGLDDL